MRETIRWRWYGVTLGIQLLWAIYRDDDAAIDRIHRRAKAVLNGQ